MKRIFLIVALALVFTSCATIPKQAPTLSEELGYQISRLEKSHLTLLQVYFDQKRSVVDDFINDTWIPEYTNNFFSNPEIENAWNEIRESNDTKDRIEFFIHVGSTLQGIINEKRQELMTPLNDLQQELEKQIREEYNLARSANNTLTSFLTTAAKIDEDRQRYLNMMNITDDKISAVIDQTDEVLETLANKSSDILSKEKDLKEYQEKSKDYIHKLKTLKEKISAKL